MRRFIFFLLLITTSWLGAQAPGHTGTGLASYFDDAFHGDKTKYGEIYNRNELTGAHKMYPYNSRVRVTNLENDKSVVVRIIDQGPFITGRIIEVSHRAAQQLGMLGQNTARVFIELLSTPDQSRPVTADNNAATDREDTPNNTRRADEAPQRVVVPPPAPSPAQPTPAPVERQAERTSTPQRVETRSTSPDRDRASTPAPAPAERTIVNRAPVRFVPASNDPITTGKFGPGVYKIELREPGTGKFGVQVASLTSLESAMSEVAKLQAKWFENILIRRMDNGDNTVYKLILGPFDDQASASRYSSDLKKRYKINGFTVELP